ncbi:RlpA-like double-psi beta-barrel-protein domain-containing protein-containing protein, partial [Russula dissimulans]
FNSQGTYFYTGLGSCGGINNDGQFVVAVSVDFPGAGGADCWKHVRISSGGKSVTAQIVDSCEGCGPNDLDLSPATFTQFAPEAKGVIEIQWDVLGW